MVGVGLCAVWAGVRIARVEFVDLDRGLKSGCG
jgi:hypothetical protein